jgi:transposase
MHTKEPYPSSFTDQEWALIEALMPGPHKLGRPPRYPRRSVVEGILYIVRGGCGWRMLPHDLPPWRLCDYYFMTWRKAGLWQKLHDRLRDAVRLQSGKKKPRPLRSSTARALKSLTTEACAATLRERRSWDESATSWWTRWV